MENPIENPQTSKIPTTKDFWEILDEIGQEFEEEGQNVEIKPENAVIEAQIENEGKPINVKRYLRRIELENRKKALTEQEIHQKAHKYRSLLNAVISRFGKDPEVLTEALYWKEKLISLNQPIGVLEDFISWIGPLIEELETKETQKPAQNQNKAQLFLELVKNAQKKPKKSKKAQNNQKDQKKEQIRLLFTKEARIRLYFTKAGRRYVCYLSRIDLPALKQIQAQIYQKSTKTPIGGLFIIGGSIPAVSVKRDEWSVLNQKSAIPSLKTLIQAIEHKRKVREACRKPDKNAIRRAVLGFRRLFL